MNKELKQEIAEKYKEQFELAEELEKFVEENLVPTINNYNVKVDGTDVVKSILLLVAQGIQINKACTILIREGYASSSLAALRTLLEIIINIDYILIDPKESQKRAKKYLSQNNKNENIKFRATKGLNQNLYKIYGYVCNFTHANASATYTNLLDYELNIYPSDILIKDTLVLTNSTFIYFLKSICKFYSIDFERLIKEVIPKNVETQVYYFNIENHFFEIIQECLNLTSDEIIESKKEYLDNSLNKKNKSRNKTKNKKNKKNKKK